MNRTYEWNFPLPRTHTGMLQGNGTFGTMIWGAGSVLCITIGRADFWDHRGGMSWREIAENMPRASLHGQAGNEIIGLWDGLALEESHPHHSHLAGIVPFDVFPLADPRWQGILTRSLDNWIYHGIGLWSGWCVPRAGADFQG